MGLSSSQARLLTLTSRMHDIEYKAAKLEAQKLQMANESRRAYDDYLVALDATKIQLKRIATDGSIDYVDATYNLMKENGYKITMKEQNNKPVVTQATADNFVFANGSKETFIALETGRIDTSLQNTDDGYFEIYSTEQFLALTSGGGTFSNEKCRLMTDIDLSSGYTSINISNCTLDGNGHTIKGLDKALFDQVTDSSVIKNLKISGNITTTSAGGILANSIMNSTVEDVTVSGSFTNTGSGAIYVGALAGGVGNSIINRCSAQNVTITCEDDSVMVGGLIGASVTSNITNCTSSGSVTAGLMIGGLIGWATYGSDISNCSSSATVISNSPSGSSAGGLVGLATDSTISDSYATGNVTGVSEYCGGLVGSDDGSNFSTSITLTIDNCYATGNVTSENAGGLIGNACQSKITDCRSTGTVSGTDSGTFAGVSSSITNISNSYTTQTGDKIGAELGTGTSINFALSDITITPISIASPSININAKADDSAASLLFDEMTSNGYLIDGVDFNNPAIGHEDDYVWFTNMVNAGELFISKYSREKNEYYDVSVATDTGLQEVSDEKDLRKAEAKYEADMRKIDAKDKKYDTELAAIDNERNAVKAEMETLKTVAKDNVERTFKLFS